MPATTCRTSGGRSRLGRRAFEALEPRLVLDSTVVFNEIMYNPAGDTDDSLEWVELYNQMSVDMDVSRWSIEGGVDYTFPEGTVVPGEDFLVVAVSPAALEAESGHAGALGPYTGRLSNGGEELRLVNNSGRVMNEVDYRDGGDWPVAADGSGASLAKRDSMAASPPAENWTASPEVGGTPGAENFAASFTPLYTRTVLPDTVSWKYDASGTDLGTGWREPTYDDGAWATARSAFPGVLITEAGTGNPDYLEIQNLSESAVETSGWFVALNDATDSLPTVPPDINAYHTTTWNLPETIQSGEVLHRSDQDNQDGTYWGDGIFWRTNGPGWVLLVDHTGAVADFVVWGYDDAEIASFDVTIQGRRITAAGAWDGSAVPENTDAAFSYQRIGNTDGDHAADWDLLESTSMGTQNVDLTFPFTSPGLELPSGPVTYYLRTEFQYDDLPSQTELALDTIIDDGAVFYLNGTEVYRENMPAGEVSFDTPAASEVVTPTQTIGEPISTFTLQQGVNVLAVEVHQMAAGDDDMLLKAEVNATVWPPLWGQGDVDLSFNEIPGAGESPFWFELANHGSRPIDLAGHVIRSSAGDEYVLPAGVLLAGELLSVGEAELGFRPREDDKLTLYSPGRSLVGDSVPVTGRLRGRWPDGTGDWLYPDAPTPGTANTFDFHDEIVINEIMYHHRPELVPAYAENDEEWIELYNRSDSTMDLSGWKLDEAVSYEFPPGTVIAPGEYLVVANNAAALAAKYPAIDIAGNFQQRLSNFGERIVLRDSMGNPADEVPYFEGGRWPAYADGDGPSLELRDPDADNSKGEAWAASDEAAKTSWQTYRYRGVAKLTTPGEPTRWNEFMLGMLDGAGEILLDDFSVIERPDGAAVEFIRNGSFDGGTAAYWRLLGNHQRSQVIVDPEDPGNHVLHLIASGATEYQGNHLATTFANGEAVTNGVDYEISFRAKWLTGSRQLNTHAYFNRLPKVTVLDVPEFHGTPGLQNSRYVANAGPTYDDFHHLPAVPQPGADVTVSVRATDPDGVDSMTLWYSVAEGAWTSATMTKTGADVYSATIPGQASGRVVQFYARGQDGLGATSMMPQRGPDSRALFKVEDGQSRDGPLRNFVVVMLPSEANYLHTSSNVWSNERLGATIVHNQQDVFYNAGVRLKGSYVGRDVPRVGFNIALNPDNLFRGVHEKVAIDRSAHAVIGQGEILVKHIASHAGGIPNMYDDLVHFISPKNGYTSTAHLRLAGFDDIYLDSQFENGSDGTQYEYEGFRIRGGGYVDLDIQDFGDDKEAYRWLFLITNNRTRDDYSQLIEFAKTFSLFGAELEAATRQVMDVDQWMRTFAHQALVGVTDVYARHYNSHNMRLYVRPSDGKVLAMPWDWDSSFQYPTNNTLFPGSNIGKIVARPVNRRLFYGHLLDMINTTFNTSYMSAWTQHYGELAGQNFSARLSYIGGRANYVLSQLPAEIPFRITTNDGNDFTTDGTTVLIEGDGWINVREMRRAGSDEPLTMTWIDGDTWQVVVPLDPGANALQLEVRDHQGEVVGTASIVVTSTDTGARLRDSLRVSEVNYNPYEPTPEEVLAGFDDKDDFEFVELTNIGDQPLDLLGVHFSDGVDFQFTHSGAGGPLLAITEVGTGTPDFVEIQNVSGAAVDTSGWVVAVNNADDRLTGNADINARHATLWELPASLAVDEVRYGIDAADGIGHAWGEDIFWRNNGPGWVMIVDDQGDVADFVVWDYTPEEIASLAVEVNGFDVTAADVWNGTALAGDRSSSQSLQRIGRVDSNAAADWSLLDRTMGQVNAGLTTPFANPEGLFQPGAHLVIAANADAFRSRYGESADLAGVYAGRLRNGGERVELSAPAGYPILAFQYGDSNDGGWPGRADGKGASLELLDPAAVPAIESERTLFMEDPANWRSSGEFGGTPGFLGTGLLGDVLINEVLTNTAAPGELDAIELYNNTGSTIDIGGWYLSNDWGFDPTGVEGSYRRFRIPDDTNIPPFGYVVFDEDDFNPGGGALPTDFSLDGVGSGDVWLMAADTNDKLMRFVDHVEFGPAAGDESWGRDPIIEARMYPAEEITLGDPNSAPRVGPLVISELMHFPPDPDGPGGIDPDTLEFVEIYNPTNQTVPLTDWYLDGGVDLDFATGTQIGPLGTLVVLPFDPHDPADATKWSDFASAYNLDVNDKTGFLGGYTGSLDDDGERVTLQRPGYDTPEGAGLVARLVEDEVRYLAVAGWPDADENGQSLSRTAAGAFANDPASWTATGPTPGSVELAAGVVGRHIFYNNSTFDGDDHAADAQDDAAIASDKQALLPGETATFENYTSYSRGINGLMIDVAGLPPGNALNADDFKFRTGNHDGSGAWTLLTTDPSVSVRRGAGVGGSDRITLIWPDNLIEKQWLQVTVLAAPNTGLSEQDVFYFGNAPGESGNSALDAKVNAFDMLGARNHPRNFSNPAPVDFDFDYNRDAKVNAFDMLIARNEATNFLNSLKLITAPAGKSEMTTW